MSFVKVGRGGLRGVQVGNVAIMADPFLYEGRVEGLSGGPVTRWMRGETLSIDLTSVLAVSVRSIATSALLLAEQLRADLEQRPPFSRGRTRVFHFCEPVTKNRLKKIPLLAPLTRCFTQMLIMIMLIGRSITFCDQKIRFSDKNRYLQWGFLEN